MRCSEPLAASRSRFRWFPHSIRSDARPHQRSLILRLVRRMSALLRTLASCHLLALALSGCSAVTTTQVTLDRSIPIDSKYTNALSDSDRLQIRRLLTGAGICLPIGSIEMHSISRATLGCGPIDAHPEKDRDLGYWIEVTVFRRDGAWFIERDSIRMTGRQWAM
jgi:hypothetical protein